MVRRVYSIYLMTRENRKIRPIQYATYLTQWREIKTPRPIKIDNLCSDKSENKRLPYLVSPLRLNYIERYIFFDIRINYRLYSLESIYLCIGV